MDVTTELAARRLIGEDPVWHDVKRLGTSTNALVRDAALSAAPRCSDLPAPIRQALAEVSLLGDGRATTWTTRFHRLRAGGHATRFVADVLQEASANPVPTLVELMRHAAMGWLAIECRDHQSASVRAMARSVSAGSGALPARVATTEATPAATRPNGSSLVW